jgi:hypothetical protein
MASRFEEKLKKIISDLAALQQWSEPFRGCCISVIEVVDKQTEVFYAFGVLQTS